MIGLGKEVLFRDLKALMCRNAAATKKNVDRIRLADTGVADPNKIVAHGVAAQVEHAVKLAIAAYFTSRNLVQIL
jgi:hypothetical protein